MTSDLDSIRENHRVFVDSMRNGDVSKLLGLFEDDIVFMPPADPTIVGKAEVRNWYEDYFAYFTILTLDTVDRDVSIAGNVLVERTAVSVKLEPRKGGQSIYDEARILSVWRRQEDGSWKLWQSMWNSVKPIGAGTNRFLVRFMNRDE